MGWSTHGAIVWLPLCEIDDETPSLELAIVDVGRYLDHITDESSYSVLKEPDETWPLVAITRMRPGQALLMGLNTIHRSSVKPWHTKERISLDLRFLPL